MLNTIFFDLDGVLTTDPKGSFTMSKNLTALKPGLSLDGVLASFRKDIDKMSHGDADLFSILRRVCAEFDIPADDRVLRKVIGTMPLNDPMFELARRLSHEHKVGMITDNARDRIRILDEDHGLASLFDPIVVSSIEKASKSDGTTKIFEIALKRAECAPEESLFIDNQKKNLVVPASMGMHVHFHDDAKNDMDELVVALRRLGAITD